MNLNRQIPTTILPQAIAKAGKRAGELKALELGIIDCDTNLTVDVASYAPDKNYQIVFKTASKGMDNAMFPDQRGAKLPIRLDVGQITKAHSFEGGNQEAKPFVAYYGYDGISDCKTISLDCAQDYALHITVRGKSVRDVFGRNFSELVPFNTGCCEGCDEDEAGAKTTAAIIKAIKTSSFWIENYFTVEPVKSCCVVEAPFDKKDYATFTLDVCDNGTSGDLAQVQRAYPDFDVERVKRDAPTSTYEICIAAPNLPADQAIIDPLLVTLEEAIAIDPQVPADVAAAQLAYDTAVAAARVAAKAAAMPEDFTRTNVKPLVCDECPDCPQDYTKVDTADKVLVCVSAPALTVPSDSFSLEYYEDAEAGQVTIDAQVEALGALVPGFVAGSAKLLGSTCDDVTVQVCVEKDTAITEHGVAGINLTSIGECTGRCEGESTLPWCEGVDKYKVSRTKCITLKKDDCEEGVAVDETHPLFAAIKAQLELDDSILADSLVVRKDNDCLVSFEVKQCSNCLEDGCDTYGKDGAKFTRLTPFEGQPWEDCDCEGWTFDDQGCPVAPEAAGPDNCQHGIKFTGALVNPETGKPCIYDIGDQVDREPLEIELTLVRQYQDETFADCNAEETPAWTVVQQGQAPEGLGQFVGRQEVLSREYDLYMYFSPKEALGSLYQNRLGYDYQFDPNKRYNHISLYINRDMPRTYHKHDGMERHLLKIFIDADNVSFFEEVKTFFNATLLKHGVCKLL